MFVLPSQTLDAFHMNGAGSTVGNANLVSSVDDFGHSAYALLSGQLHIFGGGQDKYKVRLFQQIIHKSLFPDCSASRSLFAYRAHRTSEQSNSRQFCGDFNGQWDQSFDLLSIP